MKLFIRIAVLPWILLWYWPAQAQKVYPNVTIQIANTIPSAEQALLQELPDQLETYINSLDWPIINEDIEIPVTIQIIVESMSISSGEKSFIGQFLISSPSGENFRDRSWRFKYQPGQMFSPNQTEFDPLTGLVDYYLQMVIAGELDCYLLMGGTPYYDMALNTANQGLTSLYPVGWTARLEQVKSITDADHIPLREAKFYYYEGLFFVEAKKNRNKARELSKKVVDLLEAVYDKRPNSPHLKRFLDAHAQEFCTLFSMDENDYNLRRLMRMDPAHRSAYEKCL